MSEAIQVGVGVLVRDRGSPSCRVLIARRRQETVLGGYWELPGGKVEVGETLPACVAREFEEELGIRVAVEQPLRVCEHAYDHGTVRLHSFYCRLVAGEPQPLEVAEWRWVAPGDLVEYRFPPANDALIQAVMRDLAGASPS